MSLKAFHILFIVLSIILADGFGIWALRDYSVTASKLNLGLGILSLVGGVGLIFYLVFFLAKMKKISHESK